MHSPTNLMVQWFGCKISQEGPCVKGFVCRSHWYYWKVEVLLGSRAQWEEIESLGGCSWGRYWDPSFFCILLLSGHLKVSSFKKPCSHDVVPHHSSQSCGAAVWNLCSSTEISEMLSQSKSFFLINLLTHMFYHSDRNPSNILFHPNYLLPPTVPLQISDCFILIHPFWSL